MNTYFQMELFCLSQETLQCWLLTRRQCTIRIRIRNGRKAVKIVVNVLLCNFCFFYISSNNYKKKKKKKLQQPAVLITSLFMFNHIKQQITFNCKTDSSLIPSFPIFFDFYFWYFEFKLTGSFHIFLTQRNRQHAP